MELGERRRTMWPFRTPMPEREEETESTADQTSGKVRWRPEEASMKAILPWWARDEMKVVTSRDSLEGKAMGLRLLQKVDFDLEKPLLGLGRSEGCSFAPWEYLELEKFFPCSSSWWVLLLFCVRETN
ncbi:hypothetical protein RHGRI_011109 [Rhododendron griersonianum]|uniref:Uncharacterized protein n=1 Tax=Rhododendron griersonianum TaxID=479676 RepID=A0AAV6KL93_9ERIC|nr:hypothetical protein RHGRI_011109 [Rhododendron griersonianum]